MKETNFEALDILFGVIDKDGEIMDAFDTYEEAGNFKEAHPNEADHIEPIAFGIGFYDL